MDVMMIPLLLCGVTLAPQDDADVPLRSFTLRHEIEVGGDPGEVYDLFTGDVSPWWDHTFSEKPHALLIEPRAGGGFYEWFDDQGNGVQHAVVTWAERGRKLVFRGPLGLHGQGLDLICTFEFAETAGGTSLKARIVGVGVIEAGWKEAIDGVWKHFLEEQFGPYVESKLGAPIPAATRRPNGFLLGQSVFDATNQPQPTQFVLVTQEPDGSWNKRTVSDPGGGNVCHKAQWFQPPQGDPGVLTISANPPFVKIWREVGSEWEAEVLWQGSVGTKQDRLREFELGDVTGNGLDDIVIVTHDQGVVLVLEWQGRWVEHRLGGVPAGQSEWIHECELADCDGDGRLEIYCTPADPYSLGGKPTEGRVRRWRRAADGSWSEAVVAKFPGSHLKEILACDLDGTGPVLIASVEGAQGGQATTLYRLRPVGLGFQADSMLSLPSQLCRFLACGDTDGDGVDEVIAATFSHGIFSVTRDGTNWKKKTVISSLVSASFEHAIVLRDLDGDGIQEIVAASDKQKRLQSFRWNPDRSRYERKKLINLDGHAIFTFGLTAIGDD